MKDPKVIRPDDRVVIEVPKFVARVGYPKTVEDYLPQVRESDIGKEVARFFQDSAVHGARAKKFAYQRARIEHDLAYVLAKQDGFGGKERSIHWLEIPELAGVEALVNSVSTRMTGTYYPPYGGWRDTYYYGDEWDYEPGGLMHQKSHRILDVWPCFGGANKLRAMQEYLIPVYHVKKIVVR